MARFVDGEAWHLGVKPEDLGEYVLLPGDPFRTDIMAKYLDDAKLVGHKREVKSWTGTLDGVKVSIVSTGMGGPSAAIVAEELIASGCHTLLRVGTAGRVSEKSKDTSLDGVVVNAAVRDEGTTRQYIPIEYPAVANRQVVSALVEAAKTKNKNFLEGIAHCKDSFYGQHEPGSMPNEDELLSRWKAWERGNVVCSEMETAALFVVSSIRDVRAGAIMNFTDIEETIQVAVEAIRLLIQQDR